MKTILLALLALPLSAQVAITLTPSSVMLYAGQKATFQAVVTGSTNAGSSSAMSPSLGVLIVTAQKQLGDQVAYTAPDAIATQQTVTITATAKAAPVTASVTVTLMPTGPPVPGITLTWQDPKAAIGVHYTVNRMAQQAYTAEIKVATEVTGTSFTDNPPNGEFCWNIAAAIPAAPIGVLDDAVAQHDVYLRATQPQCLAVTGQPATLNFVFP